MEPDWAGASGSSSSAGAASAWAAAALAAGGERVALEVYQPTSGYSVTFKLNEDPAEWPNTSVADYYGLGRVEAVFVGEEGGEG